MGPHGDQDCPEVRLANGGQFPVTSPFAVPGVFEDRRLVL